MVAAARIASAPVVFGHQRLGENDGAFPAQLIDQEMVARREIDVVARIAAAGGTHVLGIECILERKHHAVKRHLFQIGFAPVPGVEFGSLLKRALSGEGMRLTYADGRGKLYLADQGKKIIILSLKNETLVVNGNDVLAFEPSLQHKITMMKKIVGMMAGGLFNVRFEGSGLLAITSHYQPLTLRVQPGRPLMTDPNATIAWSGSLTPELKTDVSLRTFLGRGSGESMQMCFQGDGFVIVQPYEEVYMQQAGG